jgi:ketosteroid isomerase-like protein
MAGEKVEIVRAAYDRLNRGDVEGLIELCDDDFVMDMSERVFNPDTYTGPDGIRRFYEGVEDAWKSYHWDIEETRVAGDAVVALLHCTAEGHQAGLNVDWHVAWLWRFREGTPIALRFYRDPAAALDAVGLR